MIIYTDQCTARTYRLQNAWNKILSCHNMMRWSTSVAQIRWHVPRSGTLVVSQTINNRWQTHGSGICLSLGQICHRSLPSFILKKSSIVKRNWISSRTGTVSHMEREERGEKSRQEWSVGSEDSTTLMQSGYYFSNLAEECLPRLY